MCKEFKQCVKTASKCLAVRCTLETIEAERLVKGCSNEQTLFYKETNILNAMHLMPNLQEVNNNCEFVVAENRKVR